MFDQNCDIIMGRAALGRNFDISVGWAAREACSMTWCLLKISEFALEQRKPVRNLKPEIHVHNISKKTGWKYVTLRPLIDRWTYRTTWRHFPEDHSFVPGSPL